MSGRENMNTRREFLSITFKGATMIAATGLLPAAASASAMADMAGSSGIAETSASSGNKHYNALRHFQGDFHAVKKVSFPQKKRIRVR